MDDHLSLFEACNSIETKHHLLQILNELVWQLCNSVQVGTQETSPKQTTHREQWHQMKA